jgi:hypothetical protein
MIDDGRRRAATTTERGSAKELDPSLLPFRAIAALASRRPVLVVPGLPFAIGGKRMLATLAVGDNATTSTKRGRTHRH